MAEFCIPPEYIYLYQAENTTFLCFYKIKDGRPYLREPEANIVYYSEEEQALAYIGRRRRRNK